METDLSLILGTQPTTWRYGFHPTDPSLSTIIGTNKEGGLAVSDLNTTQVQYLFEDGPNNVDLQKVTRGPTG